MTILGLAMAGLALFILARFIWNIRQYRPAAPIIAPPMPGQFRRGWIIRE